MRHAEIDTEELAMTIRVMGAGYKDDIVKRGLDTVIADFLKEYGDVPESYPGKLDKRFPDGVPGTVKMLMAGISKRMPLLKAHPEQRLREFPAILNMSRTAAGVRAINHVLGV